MDELTTDTGSAPDEESRLTPRIPPAPRRRNRNPFAFGALAVIVVAMGFVVFNALGDATLFFRNADEAVAQRDDLGDRRFRIQGLVDGDTIVPTDRGVDFVITHNGVRVTISHEGDPPDLFQPGVPVLLEGRWAQVGDADLVAPVGALETDAGWFFSSDRFYVKHTEVYVEEHPDRTEDYTEQGGAADVATDEGTEAAPAR